MGYLYINTWFVSKGKVDRFPYENPEDSRSNRNYCSFATYSKKGVLSINYMCSLDYPVNQYASQKLIGQELAALFGSKKYICIVSPLTAKSGGFKFCLEFYTHLSERPDKETMLKVGEIAKANAVECLFVQKDKNKEIMGVYTYDELPGSKARIYEIIRQCQGRGTVGKFGDKATVKGGIWEYA